MSNCKLCARSLVFWEDISRGFCITSGAVQRCLEFQENMLTEKDFWKELDS